MYRQWLAAASCVFLAAHASAVPLEFSSAVVDDDAVPPLQESIAIAAEGEYRIRITDFGVDGTAIPPADDIRLVIVAPGATAASYTASAVGVDTETLAAGSYDVYLFIAPDPAEGRASVGLNIQTAENDPTTIVDKVVAVETTPTDTNPTGIELRFEAAASDTFTLTISDIEFPTALTGLEAIAIRESDGAVLGTVPTAGNLDFALVADDAALITIIATRVDENARSAVGYAIEDSSGTELIAEVRPVGEFSEVIDLPVSNPPLGETLTLTINDFGLPAAIGNLRTVVVAGAETASDVLARSGSIDVVADVEPLRIWLSADPGAIGTVGLRLATATGTTVFETLTGFGPAEDDTAAVTEAEFNVPTAGEITLSVADFEFPAAFASIEAAVIRNGAIVEQIDSAGEITFATTAGQHFLAVVATTSTPTDIGLFGVTVSQADEALLETTGAAGATIEQFDFTSPGDERIRAGFTDLGFPEPLTELRAVVSQGSSLFGTLLGGTNFNFFDFDTTAGDYKMSIIAVPGATDGRSVFTVAVDIAPPPPALSFSADSTSVDPGSNVTLTWDSENADTCTAFDAWSGSKALAGSEVIANVSSVSTFSLSCSGPGGDAEESVVVRVASLASRNSGGGATGWLMLAMLLVLYPIRRRAPR